MSMFSSSLTHDDLQAADLQFAASIDDSPRNGGSPVTARECCRYMLWIDGVGAWQLCAGKSFVVGAPSQESQSADIALLANISRRHATLSRIGDEWQLDAHQPTTIAGRAIAEPSVVRSGDQICLAERVRLGFRVPSVLSSSAVIDFESDHRPPHSVDGIILLVDQCLLGPKRDHHICCSSWSDFVVLFHQNGQLKCRSRAAIQVNGQPTKDSRDSAVLKHGSIVTGEDFRFRVEQMSL